MSKPVESSPLESDSTMTARELTLIVATTSKMGIGRGGTLPWTGLKKEMAYFARVTKRASPGSRNAVIMGRKTWESIPPKFRPLRDRTNVVITRATGLNADGGFLVGSVEGAVEAVAKTEAQRAFIIGGAQIYKAALERKEAKRILLTRVLSDFECDTFFPVQLDETGKTGGWERKSKEELDRWTGEQVPEGVQEENGTRYVFEMWEKSDS
ncbi:dihydrofolate reductase-like domain-containing protein [Hyaloscypha sp. PMI_1271]|nr:dihydrofolate reductase-like domain-containing protein [Hyaloscypha sp. PMI_1271]